MAADDPHTPMSPPRGHAAVARGELRAPSVRSLLSRFAALAFVVVGSGVVLGKLAVDAVIERVESEAVQDQVTRTRFASERIEHWTR